MVTQQWLEVKLNQLSAPKVLGESDGPNIIGAQREQEETDRNREDFLSHCNVAIEDKIIPLESHSFFVQVIIPSFGFMILAIAGLFLIDNTDLFAKLTGVRISELIISGNHKSKDKEIYRHHSSQLMQSFLLPSMSLNDGHLMRLPISSFFAPLGNSVWRRSFIQGKFVTEWTRNTWEKVSRDHERRDSAL